MFNYFQGVIFSICYDSMTNQISSTSDDRTVRIWKVNFTEEITSCNDSEAWQNANIELQYTMFGHTARVWRSLFLSDERIVSIGEVYIMPILNHY